MQITGLPITPEALMILEAYHICELARLTGVQDATYAEVEGKARVYAIADEDLERETDETTSAVHFVRFELTADRCAVVKAGTGVKLGCDHMNYSMHIEITPEAPALLAGDWA